MQDRKQNKRFSLPLVAIAAGVILAAGGGAAWWAKHSLERTSKTAIPSLPSVTEQTKPIQPEPITQQRTIEVCWLNPQDNTIELVTSTLSFQKSVQPKRILETAFERLLAGPQNPDYTTGIPEGTKLLGLSLDKEGVRVNLSQEFVSGGGSASMTSRLAQVVYTATSSNRSDKVWISIEGKPLETLGGEGLLIGQPMTRETFDANFEL